MKRILALILALSLCLPLVPAWAEEGPEAAPETLESLEPEAPTEPEETTEATTETEAPTEEATETEAPTEEAAEAPEPTEESTEPPTEEPTEETAAAETEELPLPEEIVFINPLYEDVLTEADIPAISMVAAYAALEDSYYATVEEASQAMRQSLKNREPSFHAEFRLAGVPVAAEFMRSIYAGAVAHTGVPTEGDYLRYEFGGYRGSYRFEQISDEEFSCQFTFNFLYYTTEDQEAELDGAVDRLLGELNLEGKDNREKIDTIYHYLCRNVTYDRKNLNDKTYTLKYTAYAALIHGTAVCQGYATAFYRLCLESGVDARVISSKAMNHAWNIVQLGEFYYCLDATWDAEHDPYLYYLKGSEYWLEKHRSNGVSTLGDQFQDGAFSTSYPLAKKDPENPNYTLEEDGTLVLGPGWGSRIDDFSASQMNGVLVTNAPWREVADQVRRIQFREGVTYIGSNAFRGLSSLEELTLPDTVEAVADSAFRDCGNLKTLVILAKTDMAEDAFLGCDQIQDLAIYAAQDARFLTGCLENLTRLSIIGEDYMCGYSASRPAPWSGTGVASIDIEEGVGKIGNYGFANCAALEQLTLPKSLRYIGSYAFQGCESLKTMTFTGSARPTIYSGAFTGDTLTCLYPCTWAATPRGDYGGAVTWKGNHAPEFVERQEPTEEADGVLAHWQCGLCGKRFLEESCDAELSQEDVILYRETYPIAYMDMEGAENPNPDSYASPRGLTLKAPSRTGYLFGGWYLDEHYREKITSVAIGTRGALTLYPKWTAISYTLSFSANGGSGSASRRRLSYGTDTVLPDSGFRRKGYTLAGWNTAKDGTGDAYLPGETVRDLKETNKASLTLYAQWSPITYRLLLDPNDGITEASTQELTYNEGWVLPTQAGDREGYHISGWNTRSNGKGKTYTPGKPVKNLADQADDQVTLYGKWTVNRYKVLFHGNGATARDRTQTMTYGKTAALTANAFRRTGYVFQGWSDSPEGEVLYENREKVVSLTAEEKGTVELYAVWKPITYRLAFKANGGQGTMETLTWTYDQQAALPEPEFTRPGYIFLGWSTSSSGRVRYEDGASVKNLTATQGKTVTLYALWRAYSYEIHFDGGQEAQGTMKPMLRLSWGRNYTLTANRFKYPGHSFLGWSTDPAATVPTWKNRARIRDLASYDGESIVLYAVWK